MIPVTILLGLFAIEPANFAMLPLGVVDDFVVDEPPPPTPKPRPSPIKRKEDMEDRPIRKRRPVVLEHPGARLDVAEQEGDDTGG